MTTSRRGGEAPLAPRRPGRVLLLEDEQDVAELMRYQLTKEGYDVVIAGNGADALRLARDTRPGRRCIYLVTAEPERVLALVREVTPRHTTRVVEAHAARDWAALDAAIWPSPASVVTTPPSP